jgi:carboxyl-terminal processing protease
MLALGFIGGVQADRAGLLPGVPSTEPADVTETFSVFWQAWNLVQRHYVERPSIDPTKMTRGAIEGMLDSLGDTGHTRFLSPDDVKAEQDALAGRLEGIGAEVSMRDGQPVVVAPIPGSPAQQAGIRPGDAIVRVDGQDVGDLTVEQVVNLVRGPAGTSVTLTLLHQGETTLSDVTITRAQITVPSVSWAMLPGTTVAQILVSQFSENTGKDLVSALGDAKTGGATALALDLRNDPGGIRDEAITVASQFLRDGNVLIERDAAGTETPYPVVSGGVALDVPLVVLVNQGTASSAEIVAGAIQDGQRAKLVGATTFGTGTVLSQFSLSDGSAIFLGTAEWLTPNGRQIWHHGITPDVPVALPTGATALIPNQVSSMTADQLQASQDTQLLRALAEVSALVSTAPRSTP